MNSQSTQTPENPAKFQMVAKTFQGLEEVLRDELIDLGAENVEAGKRMVQFEGDLAMMYKANICCRTALRILKPIVKFTASDPDELYDAVREIDWEKYMTPDSTFSIDSTVSSTDFTHSKFVTYRVKDGIVDHFNDICGRRPSIRLQGADIQLNVHISENRVTISLDSSGEPLSKRGYKVENTEAPINEVLAAGIIMLSGWKGDSDFADPMCGSGTFLVEAALIAANINPGIYREKFAFETWEDFDAELFEEIYNDDSGEREFAYKIYGGDIDAEAVKIARRNVKSAKVENMVEISCKSIEDWTDNAPEGTLVMNPPYGQRINPTNMTAQALYRTIGTCLKSNFEGWNAWIIGLEDGFMKDIGLKPSVKYPLLNGGLECTLNEYVMFGGAYNDFRAEGGVVKHTSARQDAPKVRRMTDKEWEDDAKRYDGKSRKKDAGKGDRQKRRIDDKPRRHTADYMDDRFDSEDFTPRRSNDDRPRRFDGGGERRSHDDKPRRFDGGGERRSHDDKPRRFDGGGERRFNSDKPRRFDSGSERRFNSDKPRRFDGGGERRFNEGSYSSRQEARTISDKCPKLTNYTEHKAPGKMRSRKNFRNSFNQDDDE
ncbi:MAG: methyltransferase [Muribaculaceae bacterium]|nr:methyltransferase [Muribaculaceae bacterium]